MCCRLSLAPAPDDWRRILKIAGFATENEKVWQRKVGHSVVTLAEEPTGSLGMKLYPTIGGHSPEDHLINAPAAAVMLKTAMTLAEFSNGRIQQEALVGACLVEAGVSFRLLAMYPMSPMRFESLCRGFREVFLRGIPQLGPPDPD